MPGAFGRLPKQHLLCIRDGCFSACAGRTGEEVLSYLVGLHVPVVQVAHNSLQAVYGCHACGVHPPTPGPRGVKPLAQPCNGVRGLTRDLRRHQPETPAPVPCCTSSAMHSGALTRRRRPALPYASSQAKGSIHAVFEEHRALHGCIAGTQSLQVIRGVAHGQLLRAGTS